MIKESMMEWTALGLAALLAGAPTPADAQAGQTVRGSLGALEYCPERAIPSGTLLEYSKSNVDGSHPSRILLYVAAHDRIESFKPNPEGSGGALVTARMDWKSFSAERLESWWIDGTGERTLRATLERIEGEPSVVVRVSGSEDTVRIGHFPWHSYDFDFASLNVTLPHLRDPVGGLRFGIADVDWRASSQSFRYFGTVTMSYEGKEELDGRPVLRYRIDGPGLRDRGGNVWVDAERRWIVEYRIALPDEPGYESGRLGLDGTRRLDRAAWEDLVRRYVTDVDKNEGLPWTPVEGAIPESSRGGTAFGRTGIETESLRIP